MQSTFIRRTRSTSHPSVPLVLAMVAASGCQISADRAPEPEGRPLLMVEQLYVVHERPSIGYTNVPREGSPSLSLYPIYSPSGEPIQEHRIPFGDWDMRVSGTHVFDPVPLGEYVVRLTAIDNRLLATATFRVIDGDPVLSQPDDGAPGGDEDPCADPFEPGCDPAPEDDGPDAGEPDTGDTDAGTPCTVGMDCAGEADEPSCDDGQQNQAETGIDCGGPCAPCDDARAYSAPTPDISVAKGCWSPGEFMPVTIHAPVSATDWLWVRNHPDYGGKDMEFWDFTGITQADEVYRGGEREPDGLYAPSVPGSYNIRWHLDDSEDAEVHSSLDFVVSDDCD